MTRASHAARILLGVVLCLAGLMKVAAGWEFAQTIAHYRILPPVGSQVLAVLLPWWEISAGLLLLAGLWVRASSLLSAALFASFAVAVASAILRGLDIDCGCFGTGMSGRIGLRTLAVDGTGFVLSLLVLWAGESVRSARGEEAAREVS